MQSKEKGFTLIELMIIVAIIGIIVAIAVPRFAMMRERTKPYQVIFIQSGVGQKEWVIPFKDLSIEEHEHTDDIVTFTWGGEKVELHGQLTLYMCEELPPAKTGTQIYGHSVPPFEILIGREGKKTPRNPLRLR